MRLGRPRLFFFCGGQSADRRRKKKNARVVRGKNQSLLTVHAHFRELSLLNQAQLRRVIVHALVFGRKRESEKRERHTKKERQRRVSRRELKRLRANKRAASSSLSPFFHFFSRGRPLAVSWETIAAHILLKVTDSTAPRWKLNSTQRERGLPRDDLVPLLSFALDALALSLSSLGDRLASLSSLPLSPARALRGSSRSCFQSSPCHENRAAAHRGDSEAAATRPP